jgi:hypothetical protein
VVRCDTPRRTDLGAYFNALRHDFAQHLIETTPEDQAVSWRIAPPKIQRSVNSAAPRSPTDFGISNSRLQISDENIIILESRSERGAL